MEDPGAYFLQQFQFERVRKQRHRLSLQFLLLITLIMSILGWYSFTLPLSTILLFEGAVCLSVILLLISLKRKALERQDALFMLLEVDPEILERSNRMDIAYQAAQSGNLQSIQVSKTQRRNRGSDEKGFTSGRIESQLDKSQTRRDSALSESTYQGLEDDLRPSELLVNEANVQYQKRAQQQWDEAESKDTDLIEAGVKRLGDLVKTDWFEKNAKQGAVQELMDSEKADDTY
tara:strand:+ start:1969 stop:2667 length:699 start_codon:yes stop_codon:yes gene_type:complete